MSKAYILAKQSIKGLNTNKNSQKYMRYVAKFMWLANLVLKGKMHLDTTVYFVNKEIKHASHQKT